MTAEKLQEKRKAMAFRKTEKLLYSYRALKEHLMSESEYLGMAFKRTSGSIIKFYKAKTGPPDENQIIQERKESYNRSVSAFEKLQSAIMSVSGQKWYRIIDIQYLQDNGRDLTMREITEILSADASFSDNVSEKTVRRHRDALIRQIAVYIFGSDAI